MNKPDKMISLVLGDWSDDGHGKTETYNILSSLTKDALFKAYEKGSVQLGFNFINDVCEAYEDSNLSKDKLNILVEHGLTIEDLGLTSKYDLKEATDAFEDEDSEGLGLYHEAYVHIFLFIVKLGDKDFQFQILKGELNPSINIGGYGMFT